MPTGKRKRKRDGPIMFFLLATVLVVALLLVDDVILYFFIESMFELHPAFALRFTVAFIFLLLNIGLIWLVFKLRKQKAQTGREAMMGKTGVVTRMNGADLWVQVHGELWRARCQTTLQVGDEVIVRSLKGLVLQVEPLAQGEKA